MTENALKAPVAVAGETNNNRFQDLHDVGAHLHDVDAPLHDVEPHLHDGGEHLHVVELYLHDESL